MTDIRACARVSSAANSVGVGPGHIPGPEAVQITLEQIDLVKRMAARYQVFRGRLYRPPTCAASTSPAGSPR